MEFSEYLSLTMELYELATFIMIPSTENPPNFIHLAIWVPIAIGLLTLLVAFVQGLMRRRTR